MRTPYKILYHSQTAEITEKKSRFIANFKPVKTEAEALNFIEETRKKYWDARHNCYAWIIGENGEQKRCSDDGEPSQTAGKPMLDVLEGAGLVNICAVVTRYFGGTLLGTGGLVRAYSGAVKVGLENSTLLTAIPAVKAIAVVDYHRAGKIQYLLAQQNIITLNSEYTDQVELTLLVPEESRRKLEADILEAAGGQAVYHEEKEVFYCVRGKEVLLL